MSHPKSFELYSLLVSKAPCCVAVCRRHGVLVSMDECKAWDDGCCKLRIARPGVAAPATSTAADAKAAEPAAQPGP